MAGDKKREMRNVAARETGEAKGIAGPQLDLFRNLYNQGAQQNMQHYGELMGGFKNFQDTGGYSPGDLSNIRSRAVSPIRAAYANASRDVNRQKSLQGGYSPGQGVLKARMAREQGQSMSDASTGAEAAIAQMVNQGKQFGLQGATGLYGTTPGLTSMFGNQVLNAMNQRLGINQDAINAEFQAQQLPGRWEGTLGRIGDVARLGGQIAAPWLTGGASNLIPSGRVPGMGSTYNQFPGIRT